MGDELLHFLGDLEEDGHLGGGGFAGAYAGEEISQCTDAGFVNELAELVHRRHYEGDW